MTEFSVSLYYDYDKLPDKAKEILDGPYDDFVGYLVIEWPDGNVEVHTDGGEPEDQLFCRDWSWVKGAISKAYKAGEKEGYENCLAANGLEGPGA